MEKRPDSGHPPGEVAPQPNQGWRKLWDKVLLFLAIIGLRAERKTGDYAAQLARFKLYHAEFRRLLSANNSFLEGLPELEQKRQGKAHFDRAFLARKVIRAVADINSMVESLNSISGGRYRGLRPALDRITAALNTVIEEPGLAKHADLVLDLPDIRSSHADIVGGKMANLAEMANALGLPTPDGFAVTTEGFRVLVEEGGLRSWIQTEHLELHSHSDIAPLSETLRQGIMRTPLPQRLAETLLPGLPNTCSREWAPIFPLPCARAPWGDAVHGSRLRPGQQAIDRRHERLVRAAGGPPPRSDVAPREHRVPEARRRAETANKAKSRFLATMSHELRTPLNAIIVFSDIMRQQMFGPIGHAKYADYARDIQHSGQHLLQIINQILDLPKVEAGKWVLDEEIFPLDQAIAQARQCRRGEIDEQDQGKRLQRGGCPDQASREGGA